MGIVFLAHDTKLNRSVAIKILRPEIATAKAAEKFLHEAQVLADLSHPNIIPVYDSGEADGLFFYVMAFITGETLAAGLRRGPLKSSELYMLADGILSGLEYAHQKKWIHRDIKPGNIFLQDGRAIIGDFGISRQEGATTSSSDYGPAGTPGYMAPEQLAGGHLTSKVDIYSVGVVLYEASTGRRWTDLEERWSAVPRAMRRVVKQALADDEAERPDAATLRQAVVTARIRAERRRERLLWAASLVVVVGILVLPPPPPVPPSSALAILPFTRSEQADPLGRRLARYAGNRLELFRRLRLQPLTLTFSDDNPRAHVNAAQYVGGDVDLNGRSGVLHVEVRRSGDTLVRRVLVSGDTAHVVQWGNAVADSIVHYLFPEYERAYRELGNAGGSSDPQAVDEFINGQDAFHRDAYAMAETHFRRALDLDPRFSIAAWHLALARRWARQPFEADLRRLAAMPSDSLPEHYRAMVEAQLVPDLTRRLRLYRNLIARFPDDGYAALLYADDAFHFGPLIGTPLDSALPLMESATRKNTYLDQAPAYDHLVWGSTRQGRREEASRALDQRMAIAQVARDPGFDEGARQVRFLRLAYHERFNPSVAAIMRLKLLWRPDSALIRGIDKYLRMGVSFDVPWAQISLGRILVRRGNVPAVIAQGHEAQGLAFMQVGRFRAALAELDSAAALLATDEAEFQRAEWRLAPRVLGLPVSDSLEAARARERLRKLGSDSALGPRALWMLAIDALTRGDREQMDHYGTELVERTGTAPATAQLATLYRALELADRHQLDSALALSESLVVREVSPRVPDPFARALLYLRRGEWLTARGRLDAADRTLLWYENSDVVGWPSGEAQAGEVDGIMSVYARLRRGELALQAGRKTDGCRMLKRVVELWADADLSLDSLRSQARALARNCP